MPVTRLVMSAGQRRGQGTTGKWSPRKQLVCMNNERDYANHSI